MTHASLSPEGRLQAQLDALKCSLRSFSAITGIALTTLSRILSGERSFTEAELENVESSLDEMGRLQIEINQKTKSVVGIDWNRTETADTITVRKIARFLIGMDGDHTLEQAAQQFSDRTPTLPK